MEIIALMAEALHTYSLGYKATAERALREALLLLAEELDYEL